MIDQAATVNISFTSSDWRGQALSNFSLSPFVLEDRLFASVEGFIQGIKFAENDPRREQAFQLSAWEAKRLGGEADRRAVYWNAKQVEYGSAQHHALIEAAIRARIAQSQSLQVVLLSTQGAVLVHETGQEESPTTSLPASVFCSILTAIRDELITAQGR